MFLDTLHAALRDELETESWHMSSLRTSFNNTPTQQLLAGVRAVGPITHGPAISALKWG